MRPFLPGERVQVIDYPGDVDSDDPSDEPHTKYVMRKYGYVREVRGLVNIEDAKIMGADRYIMVDLDDIPDNNFDLGCPYESNPWVFIPSELVHCAKIRSRHRWVPVSDFNSRCTRCGQSMFDVSMRESGYNPESWCPGYRS